MITDVIFFTEYDPGGTGDLSDFFLQKALEEAGVVFELHNHFGSNNEDVFKGLRTWKFANKDGKFDFQKFPFVIYSDGDDKYLLYGRAEIMAADLPSLYKVGR